MDGRLSLQQIMRDSVPVNTLLTALIMGSLYYDAEIWWQDYPREVQEQYGPRRKRAERLSYILAVPFLLVLLLGVVRSNRRLRRANGGRLPFRMAFLNSYALLLAFWLHDLLIIDWFLLGVLKPKFVYLPGTEGMAAYDDHMYHLRESLPALPGMAVPALIIALVMAR
jgi:hypothetical protein